MAKAKLKSKVVEISVTAKDIAYGQPGNPFACPIALAVSRKIKDAQGVEVDAELEYYLNGKTEPCEQYFKSKLPAAARKFISKFDQTGVSEKAVMPKPFKFKVNIQRIN